MVTTINIKDQELHLLPERGIYWPTQRALLLADLHLGKATHFQKAGIAVPNGIRKKNLTTLSNLMDKTLPEEVYFLGDLFHSNYNSTWDAFASWMKEFPDVQFTLVKGNHDILADAHYESLPLRCCDTKILPPFLLTHHPEEVVPDALFNLCGHVHPGILLRGKAKQSLRLPCYYFSDNQGILPAFGAFTGLFILSPKKQDRIFVIAEDKVISI